MKVALIQVDGKMPNLALMKLAAWHKKKGDDVTVLDMSHLLFDRVYASKVFVGGSGYDLKSELPPEIEALTPDYAKFKTDYSIGFTSRGCIRDCGFCIVREKEGTIREVPFDWISHHKVLLLDNNFLASPLWRGKLEYFIRQKLKVCFNQGLDIRLIDSENAKLLAQVLYYDLHFKKRRLYFAFDSPSLESLIMEKVALLNKEGIPSSHLMFYVLVGYENIYNDCLTCSLCEVFDYGFGQDNVGTFIQKNTRRDVLERGVITKGNSATDGCESNNSGACNANTRSFYKSEESGIETCLLNRQNQTGSSERVCKSSLERWQKNSEGICLPIQPKSSENNQSRVCTGINSGLGNSQLQEFTERMDCPSYKRCKIRQQTRKPVGNAKEKTQYVALCEGSPRENKRIGTETKRKFAIDYHRFKVLDELGCLPFVMIYNNGINPQLRMFSRWVNKRYYKVCSFEAYLKRRRGESKP